MSRAQRYHTTWTDEQDAALERMWGEGASASAISPVVQHTRNAVISRARRKGLSPRPSPIKRGNYAPLTREQAAAHRKARRTHKPPVVVPLRPKRPSAMMWFNMPLSKTATCQHIAGDPKIDPTKCGKPALEGRPYCADHCADCYIVHTSKAQREAA